MRLAKLHLDLGLYTTNVEELLAFWQGEVGLAFEELLPVGGGVQQHRHSMNGSVLKINASRDPVPDVPPSGYRELLIVRPELAAPRSLADPDGNRVRLVPTNFEAVTGIGVIIAARDVQAMLEFYVSVMQFDRVGEAVVRCGDSLLFLERDASASGDAQMRGRGYRYLTVQVFDDEQEHRGLLQRGAHEGLAPRVLGTTARISMVRDPDGNWIEISQRASLTGPLSAGR
jgi:lactoylglutathione lyase